MISVHDLVASLPKYVRVTGSYARGEQTKDSDIDFYVPERYWQSFKKWSQENMIGTPSSCTVGALTWYEPMMMEFADCFLKQNCKNKEVLVFGRVFKTW